MENENVVVEEKKGLMEFLKRNGKKIGLIVVGLLAALFGFKYAKNKFSNKDTNEEVNSEIETTNEE